MMTNWETGYWRVFNVLVRLLGLVALGSGAVFAVMGIKRIVELGVPTSLSAPRLVTLLIGLLLATLGAAILRAPSYRPDLGDTSWRFDPFGARTPRGSAPKPRWWTGDR